MAENKIIFLWHLIIKSFEKLELSLIENVKKIFINKQTNIITMNLNVSKYEEFIFKKILLELNILNSKGFPINI